MTQGKPIGTFEVRQYAILVDWPGSETWMAGSYYWLGVRRGSGPGYFSMDTGRLLKPPYSSVGVWVLEFRKVDDLNYLRRQLLGKGLQQVTPAPTVQPQPYPRFCCASTSDELHKKDCTDQPVFGLFSPPTGKNFVDHLFPPDKDVCPECAGSGKVALFSSVVDCTRGCAGLKA